MHPQSQKLRDLAEKWADVPAGEFANAQMYLGELATALGVAPPQPKGSGYEYEFYVLSTDRKSGKESKQRIDLYRKDHFILEAKHVDGTRSVESVLRAAYAQAKGYASDVPHAPPPYLMVVDVGRTLLVWDRWSGTYGGFNLARRIDLRTLADRPEEIDFLRAVWENPASLDPRGRAAAVTREVAERLAVLSASLEGRGHDAERVARFLIRCVFTMFAEDVGLLAGKPFQTAIEEYQADPDEFAGAMEGLWAAMDTGSRFGIKRLLRFNGHFFKNAEALPLTRADMTVLLDAAKADWTTVEPTIFGTLLTRALDPRERHRLGAEYTPREYVERVVRQTVEVPIRERWSPVQTEVFQLREAGTKRKLSTALGHLRDFHAWMRGLRFLDPACGSGNFLYVTLHTVKRIELEVLREIEKITGNPELGIEEVGPWQFYGIEVKPWAREIAELTLWIGFHQFWLEHHKGVNPPEPVLKDTGTLEQRDAVLAWDEVVEIPEKSRPDPTPRIPHPVTGKLVPDPNARLPYYEYRGARQAEWPEVDFIIGNPPYLGGTRMREALGDGYVEALRAVYPLVPRGADYVMFWWYRASEAVADRQVRRAGLITTNSITQKRNRAVVDNAATKGARVVWAIPDHPWIDEEGGAAVRVAFTVLEKEPTSATLVLLGGNASVEKEIRTPLLNTDLSAHADVASAVAVRLIANQGLSSMGFALYGAGFMLSEGEADELIQLDPQNAQVLKPYLHGKDLTSRPRGMWVIDFGFMEEEAARSYPLLYDIVRDRVKPDREAKKRDSMSKYWWRFGWPRRELRQAIMDLPRYIVTPYVAKHRLFQFLDREIAPDDKLACIALQEGFHLGVLSSQIHVIWSLAAGSRLGIGNDPTYNISLCFTSFPFPDPSPELRAKIADAAERLDQHRKDALARDERVTMTGMYNVVEKLRTGEALTPKEREVHQIAACGVLRDLHDELDRLVAEAYGWPWPMEREEILERLVALHDERVEEEKRGIVRWLRPEYQIPKFGRGEATPAPELALPDEEARAAGAEVARRPWPETAVEQIGALQAVVATGPVTAQEAAARFDGAPVDLVGRHLETLVLVGEVRRDEEGRYAAVSEPL